MYVGNNKIFYYISKYLFSNRDFFVFIYLLVLYSLQVEQKIGILFSSRESTSSKLRAVPNFELFSKISRGHVSGNINPKKHPVPNVGNRVSSRMNNQSSNFIYLLKLMTIKLLFVQKKIDQILQLKILIILLTEFNVLMIIVNYFQSSKQRIIIFYQIIYDFVSNV